MENFLRKIPLSYLFLIASNVVSIYFAVTQNWSLGTVAWVYFLQSTVIGFFNFFKILSLKKFRSSGFGEENKPVQPNSLKVKIFTALFFVAHYGFFQLFFAVTLLEDHGAFSGLLKDPFFLITFVLFIINHFYSFVRNYHIDANRNLDISVVMAFPYIRVLPILVSCIMIASKAVDEKFILYFMIIKTIADLAMHILELHLAKNK